MAAGCERGVSLVGALAVGTVTSALALTVYFTVSAITTADATFAVLRHQTEFEREFAWAWCDHRFFVFTAGFASNASRAVHVERVLAAIDEGKDRFDELRSSYASQKRRSATLRRANRGFRALSRSFDDYVVFQHWALETAIEFCPESGCDFDEYSSTFVATFREEARAAQDALTEKSLRFAADIADVSTSASSVTLYIALVVEVLLLALLAALAGLVYKVKDSARRLEAQEKLARQQAHEMRNKYAPAMAVMEQFDHACRAHPLRVDDILALRDDMAMALVALGEVEAQHQARLDIYKIMRGNYVLHLETFEVLALLRDRVQVEHAVALARTRAGRVTAEAAVDYLVRVADDFVDCEEIHICCDQYILNHVVSNLLANSRKFTNQGRVIVTFCGPTENGLLTFAVEDTGTGMPEDLVPRLFRTEVATADNRGTGLGLPSCALFCETAGGYIRLDVTRQQDAMGRNGFTRFVFGISGQLVRADRRASAARADNLARRQDYVELVAVASPPAALKAAPADPKSLPDNVAVVVVDDSALNRKCAVRSLQRCQAASGANDWEYSQFETFEAAQPFLLKMHEADKLVVVCVDENMDSRGGVMTGTMGVKWLVEELGFSGIIVSTSGDPDVGRRHIELGAALNWGALPRPAASRTLPTPGKPLPRHSRALDDLLAAFALRAC